MAEQPLTARGAATRDRIVEVATREFAEHGIAGARVERIVAAARTNKAQLYAYFGSKEGLFDAIFAGSLERIVNVVPTFGVLVTVSAPRCLSTMTERAIASPWPVPLPISFVVKNGSKILSMFCGGMPVPVSAMRNTTWGPVLASMFMAA
jgi:hypothetical protein